MADIKNLRKWRNGDIINARDYVYERDAIVAEITGQSSFYVNVVDSLPTDLATGDHNNKYYLVRGGPDSKLFKIVNNIAVQHFVETYLDNLEDVIISSQTSRDVLMFKNGAWRNSPDVANDIDSLMVKGFVLEDAINLVAQNLQNHINNLSNPHNVTKQQVGLGNVDNTSDYNKPVSNPTQIEIDKQVPRSFLDVPNGIPVLDSFNKIQAKNLPNILFDGLEFASVISSSTYLSFLAHTVSNATRSQVGFYWVATTTVNVISFSYTATPPFGGTEYYKTYFVPSDEGTIQQEGVSLTTTLEAGDWIVITKKDGAGTQANPYIYYFAVVNNTYEDATSALRGIVTLSSSTSTATISNNVITDSVLKDLITTETGVANKISASQHTHPISEVDDLQTELDDLNTAVEGKAEEVHTHVKADITDFAHTHAISEVNGLQTALDGKAEEVHTHVKADITDFAHTHAAGDIVSGTLSSSVLASGVADETTFLRGDGVWAPLTGEGGGGVLAGAGVANQIAYFTASDVVSSLSTTTYPSLTELSYVKGVTVPIQDHIDDESNPHNVTVAQINAEPANANIQAHISSTSNPHSVTANQIGAEPAFTKNTAFNKNFGNTAGTVTEGNDPRLSDARTPLSHTHVSADITDLKENLKYLYIYGKAQSAITKGQAVQFAGVQGDHILLKPAVPSEINTNPDYFVGLAETTLASEDFGYVLTHGELSGINTSSYTEGAILWFASAGSTAGALTQTEPTGLNARIQVAAVNRTNAGNGIIFVRVHNVGVQVQDIVASGTRSASSFLNGEGQWAAPSTEGFVYGNGTANQLSYFTGPTEIASLDTATYPSLTEVSYVKGVTSAIQTQLNSKANLASPELTGTPLAPTATSGTNTTQIATTAFVSTAVANLINSAPGALDTLDELAAALGDDSNFASTITTALAGKSPVGHPHSTNDITNGIFNPARLGTGTANEFTFLRGNGTWASPSTEGFIVGSGVENQLTYWNGTTSVGTLNTDTYPSLTELSYVKGTTSSVQNQLNNKSNLGHTHTKSEITDFAHTHTKSQITDFAHTHAASDIVSGIISTARLGTGTADSTKFLNGNNQWVVVESGTGTFLPLAGGTMTGDIKVAATVTHPGNNTPTVLSYGKLTGYGDFYINADTDGSTTEFLYLTAGRAAGATDGLRIGYDTLLWRGNTVWHSGNVTPAVARDRTNWNDNSVINNVIGQLAWKNFGNNHTIFDASAGTTPSGTIISGSDAQNGWYPGSLYPYLMGWNGVSTYGVRVDSARTADGAGSSNTANYATSAGNADTVDAIHGTSFVRNDIYNSANSGFQVFRNIGTGTGSWQDANHTFGLENSDAGNIAINFHRAGYSSHNILYNGTNLNFDLPLLVSGSTVIHSGTIGSQSVSYSNNSGALNGYNWNSAGKDLRGAEVYTDGWFRNYNSGVGLYNQATTQHWYSTGNGTWRSESTTTTNQIQLATSGNSLRGSIHVDNSNNIGFRNESNSDIFRLASNGDVIAGGTRWLGAVAVGANVDATFSIPSGVDSLEIQMLQDGTTSTNTIQRFFLTAANIYSLWSSTRSARVTWFNGTVAQTMTVSYYLSGGTFYIRHNFSFTVGYRVYCHF